MERLGVCVGIVEVILGDVDVKVRIPNIHGVGTESDAIKTEHLPIAKPCIPLTLKGDKWGAECKKGDKLYLLNAGEYYLYIGKVYDDDSGCDGFFKYAKDCIHDERTGVEPAKKFGGFNIIVDEGSNKVEIISANKSGGSVDTFGGIVLDGNSGNIQLIAKNGSNKSIIELNGSDGSMELRTVSGDNKTCVINLAGHSQLCDCCPGPPHSVTGHLHLQTTGMIEHEAHCTEEKIGGSIGGDGTGWDGKVV